MFLIVGIALLALGLFSGGALMLGSFAMWPIPEGFTLWVTFPVLCLAGFVLIAIQAQLAVIRALSLTASALLLLLALACVATLVLGPVLWPSVPTESASLWFVLVVSTVLGVIGTASFGRSTKGAMA
jgi:hypothetical protein